MGMFDDLVPAPSGGMFEDLIPADPKKQAEADVRTGKAPDYRQPSFLPESFQRLSDQLADPFGVQDEIVGAGQFARKLFTGNKGIIDPETWTEASKAYSEAADRIRAERRVAREDFGILPEIVGGFGTSGVGRAVGPVVQGFWPTARQAAKVGAGYGAVTGAAQGEGGIAERVVSAAKGAGAGAVVGPLVSNVAAPLAGRAYGAGRDALRYANHAVRSARNPEQAAIENVADRMVASGLDPAAARAQISPPPSAQLQGRTTAAGVPFNEEHMADIIARSLRGESAAQIGADYGIHPSTVTRYVQNYQTNNPTPMNIIDLAKEGQGEGASGPLWRLGRAAHSLSGDESAEAAGQLMSRQETQSGRVSSIARQSVGGEDYELTRAAGLDRLRDEAAENYRNFYAEPDLAIDQLGDLMADPIFRRANIMAQRQARIEAIRRNQTAARQGRSLESVPEVDPSNEVFSPEMLDLIQRQLRIAAEGHVSNPSAARHAQNLREVFLDRIEDHYPTFRGIRAAYAQGQGEFGAEGALKGGRELTRRLGERADEALRGFDTMTPAQQELFRLGFARQIMDDAANPQIGGAVANKFNTNSVREIVRRLWGSGDRQLRAQGETLLRNLRREAITTKTKNDVLAGARTAELESDMGRLMEGAQTAADVATGRVSKVLGNLATRLSTQMGRRGAAETMRILTETEPARLLPILNRLANAARTTQDRQAYVTAIRELRAANLPWLAGQIGITAGRDAARKD